MRMPLNFGLGLTKSAYILEICHLPPPRDIDGIGDREILAL